MPEVAEVRPAPDGPAHAGRASVIRARGARPHSMSVSSRPLIRRPIATSLLGSPSCWGILGYLWPGVLAAGRFPHHQVTTQLPGASPDVMASLVTAPLERNFGRSSLQVMTSSSSFGISQITLQFDLGRASMPRQDITGCDQCLPDQCCREPALSSVYSKVNPADAPMVTRDYLRHDLAAPAQRHRRYFAGAAAGQIDRVGRVTVRAIRPAIRIRRSRASPITALDSRMCATSSSPRMSRAPKARSTARTSPTRSPPAIRSPWPRPTAPSS